MDININVNFNCRELIKVLTLSAKFLKLWMRRSLRL